MFNFLLFFSFYYFFYLAQVWILFCCASGQCSVHNDGKATWKIRLVKMLQTLRLPLPCCSNIRTEFGLFAFPVQSVQWVWIMSRFTGAPRSMHFTIATMTWRQLEIQGHSLLTLLHCRFWLHGCKGNVRWLLVLVFLIQGFTGIQGRKTWWIIESVIGIRHLSYKAIWNMTLEFQILIEQSI